MRCRGYPSRSALSWRIGLVTLKTHDDNQDSTPLRWMAAVDLRDAVRQGQYTIQQVVDVSVGLIDSEDSGADGFNAIIGIARDVQTEKTGTEKVGPLSGVPVIVKDNIAIRGEPTTAGSRALMSNTATADAPVVAQIRMAGGIILARAHLSEWANFRDIKSTSGWSSVGGQTKNAYDKTRNPCGSSSGSAVAVARGYAPLAVGTETLGSIMCPAGSNGVVGIKPSHSIVPGDGIIPISKRFDVAGPMARRVSDAALLLSAMVDANYGDLARRIRTAGERPKNVSGLRLGVVKNLGVGHSGTTRAFEQLQANLRRRGVILVDVELPHLDAIMGLYGSILLADFKRDLNRYLSEHKKPGQVQSLDDLIAFNTKTCLSGYAPFSAKPIVDGSRSTDHFRRAI